MSKVIIDFDLFKEVLKNFFSDNLVSEVIGNMNDNSVFVKDLESQDARWLFAEKVLPEDNDIYEVTAVSGSDGSLFWNFGYYDLAAGEWKDYAADKPLKVIAWKPDIEV